MKTNDIKLTLASIFLAILGVLAVACKDEVLVPVVDNKKADSIIAVITKLDQQNVTINSKENTITIQNAVLNLKLDSLNNSFSNNPRKIQYTVYLINAGNSLSSTNFDRTKGVDGATVTVFAGGKTLTATSADGRAVFEGLGGGNATVQISATGFTPVTFQTFFFNDNRDSFGDGAVRVASTNILIFPTTTNDAITITGQLFANKSTIDDTLGRQFNNMTYISNPGISSYTNWTQSTIHTFSTAYTNYPYNANNRYGIFPDKTMVKYDQLTSPKGANIVGYPNLSPFTNYFNYYFDYNVPGQILSITYTGLTSVATVDNTGKYTLKVASHAEYPGINIEVGHFTDSHTWFTLPTTIGSTKITISLTDYYTSTTNWIYRASISQESGESGIDSNIDQAEFGPGSTSYRTTISSEDVKPGTTITRNIFFFATVPAL